MGMFKNLIRFAAITGAAVGGATYLKKRQEERATEDAFEEFDNFDDEKIFDVQKDNTEKVSITINTKMLKKSADKVADKILDAKDKAASTVTEKLGDEKVDFAKEKVNTITEKAKDAANTAKDFAVEKIGEEKIDTAKEKVSEFANTAKDKASDAATIAKEKVTETFDKFKNSEPTEKTEDVVTETSEKVEEIVQEAKDTAETVVEEAKDTATEVVEKTQETVQQATQKDTAATADTEDDVNIDDILEDELEDL
ncbi:MAG: hypothetical protein K6G85_04555 [Eubacterium sp.]|nr:hypothetical protein [Eubacterium sp.]